MGNFGNKEFFFCLIPFSDEFSDIYELGIKAACRDAGANCERVDEQIFIDSILQRIYEQIEKADVIVADMTGRNPNVFFEVGYAYALKKRVILLTQQAEDIPFDLKHYPHIVYQGKIALLKSNLERKIRWCKETLDIPLPNAEIEFEFLINGVRVVDRPKITLFVQIDEPWKQPSWLRSSTKIDIHNLSKTLLKPDSYVVALSTSEQFNSIQISGYAYSTLAAGQRIYNIRITRPLFPDSWSSVPLKFIISDNT